ncbi:hypothetical protein GDO81_026954 [Engystomops pustulosus]|uniref:Uncharacterized protein n=1 Tax=Engystomops pustulosus TaxID=76066 RepID=A0AAV6YZH5_ENGPU|nr:hypothetical protein GDO81_026954 [Engystomops pustulosus]KAG8542326.1 hypothetical protein GDO81_026954 [Engystomops pustulosus]
MGGSPKILVLSAGYYERARLAVTFSGTFRRTIRRASQGALSAAGGKPSPAGQGSSDQQIFRTFAEGTKPTLRNACPRAVSCQTPSPLRGSAPAVEPESRLHRSFHHSGALKSAYSEWPMDDSRRAGSEGAPSRVPYRVPGLAGIMPELVRPPRPRLSRKTPFRGSLPTNFHGHVPHRDLRPSVAGEQSPMPGQPQRVLPLRSTWRLELRLPWALFLPGTCRQVWPGDSDTFPGSLSGFSR